MDYGEDIRAASPLQIEAYRRRQTFRNKFAPVGNLKINVAPAKNLPRCDNLLNEAASPKVDKPRYFPGSATSVVKLIAKGTAHYFSVDRAEIMSRSRIMRIASARQAAFWVTKQTMGWSLPEIGRRFGGRDHTTIHHGLVKTELKMAKDDGFKRKVERLMADVIAAIREIDPEFTVPAVRKQYVPEQQGAREGADTDAGSKSLEDGMRLDHQVAEAAAV